MNALPIVLALILMLTVITIERLEKFKNQTIVQNQYQNFLEQEEGKEFNQRQKNLFGQNKFTHRQLSWEYLLNKKLREKNEELAKQYRLVSIELIKILYQHTTFYKEMESKNPQFVEDLVNEIQQAADQAPPKTIRRIEDVARLKLADPHLQKVFYYMLKGTMDRDKYYERLKQEELGQKIPERYSETAFSKLYFPLLTYVSYSSEKPIIQLAPYELLQAIFDSDEIAQNVLIRRNELSKSTDPNRKIEFQNEFNPKRKQGLSDQFLDFRLSSTDKTVYN